MQLQIEAAVDVVRVVKDHADARDVPFLRRNVSEVFGDGFYAGARFLADPALVG